MSWHVIWRGQNWGRSGDTIGVVDFGELFDSADPRMASLDLVGDGIAYGEQWLGERTWNLHLLAAGLSSSALETAQAALEDASAPAADRNSAESFSMQRPEWSAARFLLARCVKRQIHSTVDSLGVGRLEATLQFTALDPTWYGPAVTSSAFGSGSPATIANAGNFTPTRGKRLWTASIGGALVNVKLYAGAEADGMGIWYVGSLAGGDVLTIDASTQRIAKNGTDVFDACAGVGGFPYPRFFDLAPGNTTVTLHADSGAGTATVTNRPTWT